MKKLVLLLAILLVVPGVVSAIPNPAAVYCYLMYPDQPDTFGTCHYAGKGIYIDPVTGKSYPNSPICEGECGYGCMCYPDCGHPTSESCQNTPEDEITCVCVGSSCSPPCFFPDGSSCDMWQFYCNCEPNGIGCWPGDFNCDFPCGELACREAGEFVSISKCCEGLTQIPRIDAYDDECNLIGYLGWVYICSDCGNGICESWESICNCPEDCAPIRNINQNTYYQRIQDAIDDANDGDTIIVAPGTYTGDGNRDIDFLGKAITVRSTDPNDPNIVAATIIDCNGSISEPHRGFKFHHGEHANSAIIGLTIVHGYGPKDIIGNYAEFAGGAIYCDGSSPSITNCIMIGNSAEICGGAVCNRGGSNPSFTNCSFIDNSAQSRGGAVYNWNGSSPTLRNCRFTNNYARVEGGGVYSEYRCKPVIVRCFFNNNSANNTGNGGGAIFTGWDTATITYCTFVNNFALSRGGAICNYRSNSTIYNCIFIQNSAGSFSAAIHNNVSKPIIANCTFTANSAPVGRALGSSKYGSESPCDIYVTNSIFWDGGKEIVNLDGSKITVVYSDVQGGYTGTGNIDADPCFVDPDSNDYHLLPDSPCINAGDPNYIPEPNETDLDGNPRIIGGRIDTGAYEFNHRPIAVAGPNQVAYAWIDGFADVNLDGSGSYDDDNDVLDYYWSWTIDGNDYEANGVSPTIQLPVGEHIIELIVNDGIDDSEPDQVTITVIEPMVSRLWIFPRLIRRYSWYRRPSKIMAWLRLPEGITKNQIDMDVPLILYPGGIEATSQYIFNIRSHRRRTRHAIVFAYFDRAELLDAVPDNGRVELQVVGQLLEPGQYFYGSDTIRIIARRLPHRPLHRRR